jgi:hypothetical protein
MARRLEGRNGSIYRAYILGTTQEELAAQHGLSQERVSQIIREVVASIPEEDLAERRKRTLDVLDVIGREMAAIMDAPAAQAYSNGRPMVNDDGTPILDYGSRMAAADRLVKITERQAKLLGLDAAQKVDVAVSEQAREAAQAAAADALAWLHGETDKTTEE